MSFADYCPGLVATSMVKMRTSVRATFKDVAFELEPSPAGGYLAPDNALQIVAHGETQTAAEARFKGPLES